MTWKVTEEAGRDRTMYRGWIGGRCVCVHFSKSWVQAYVMRELAR